MPKFIVTVAKGPAEVGTVFEFDAVPASLVGKVSQVPDETPVTQLEVATPEPVKRGRKKQESAEVAEPEGEAEQEQE